MRSGGGARFAAILRVNGTCRATLLRRPAGDAVVLAIQLNLAVGDRVEYLEVVQNGRVVQEVRLDDRSAAGSCRR